MKWAVYIDVLHSLFHICTLASFLYGKIVKIALWLATSNQRNASQGWVQNPSADIHSFHEHVTVSSFVSISWSPEQIREWISKLVSFLYNWTKINSDQKVFRCHVFYCFVQAFFEGSRTDAELAKKLQQDKIVFFLHLLGIDTCGHSSKPYSKLVGKTWRIWLGVMIYLFVWCLTKGVSPKLHKLCFCVNWFPLKMLWSSIFE